MNDVMIVRYGAQIIHRKVFILLDLSSFDSFRSGEGERRLSIRDPRGLCTR